MTVRWRELTSAPALAVSVAEAKKALRVVDIESIATKANKVFGSGNSQLLIVSKVAGSVGNNYQARIIVSGLSTALSISVADNVLTINSATNGGGTATSTVDQIITELYATQSAASIFDANPGVGDGSGTIVAASVGNLTAGVDSGDEDAYIGFLIAATSEVLDAITGKAFISRTFRAFYDEWPDCNEIELPITPVESVELIEYDDADDDAQDFTASMVLDAEDEQLPARLVLDFDAVYPLVKLQKPNVIRIDFTAGYGDSCDNVPAKIRQCILFLVSHWYSNREPVISGVAVLSNKVPFTFESVLNSFRLITV